MKVEVTPHGYERAEQHFEMSPSEFKAWANQAYNNGLPAEDAVGKLRDYLKNRLADESKKRKVRLRVFEANLFVFSAGRRLITVYPLPYWFRPRRKNSSRGKWRPKIRVIKLSEWIEYWSGVKVKMAIDKQTKRLLSFDEYLTAVMPKQTLTQ